MEKVNVLFIIPTLKNGGTQRFLINLINNLNKNKIDINLIVINAVDAMVFNKEGVNFYDLKCKRVRNSLFQISKIIFKIKPDIIFTLQSHLSLYLIFFKKIFARKIKFIARESNIVSEKNKDYRFPRIQNFIYKLFMKGFDLIICQSDDMLLDLKSNFLIDENKLSKINNFVDIDFVKKMSDSNKKNIYNYDFITCASTLSRQKGLERLIDSVNLIKSFKFKIAILGEGKNRFHLENKVRKLGLTKHVSFLGLKKNPYPYIKNSNVYVLSSYFEGFPNVLLEAGCLGLPSVVFNIKGGVNEIIIDNKNGFISKKNDIDEFSRLLIKSLDYDFDRNYISKNIENNFSTEKIINQFEKVILNINKIDK